MVVIFAAAMAFFAIFDMWSTLHLSRTPALVLANISGCTKVASCGTYSGANCSGSADRCMNSRKQATVSVEVGTVPRITTHWENHTFVAFVRLEKGSTSFGQ
jgi:predicted aminopeptidase